MHTPSILMVEAEVSAACRDEVIFAAGFTLEKTLAEPGCLAFHQTCRDDNPLQLVFFEVFASEQAHDFHMAQPYTKAFFATLQGKLVSQPRITHLSSLEAMRHV